MGEVKELPHRANVAAVALDSWKLGTFKRHLDAASYDYTVHPGLTTGTRILRVAYGMVSDLAVVVRAADQGCRRSKQN